MSILSSSVSVTRYIVKGKLEKPVLEKIYNGLTQNSIKDIDDDHPEKIVGWTSFENPYVPDFEGSSFVIGSYMVFSMRLDRKSIPSKVIQKHYAIEMARQLKESGRKYLSRNEKKSIKDHVIDVLSLRIPATPNIYDLIWNVEESWLWFFSNLKAANEELETLFLKSFNLSLIRLFPYTTADLMSGLSDKDRDLLLNLSPTKFTE
ncbi:MAG: recombination-associated protein RdgC [Desulfobacteraceae bacterium]|nr:recombination-associated protein RdgC [Pseudomonadota bacterium]MBU4414208.1 recombination-associated protein RdgC [Pseudomonadota bacterium]MCG2757587.1 recombination-associated protein RdgC [Desulfobacteraceae bacterium]